jgi:hypothetical protein
MGEVHKQAEVAARKVETDKLLETADWLRRAKELKVKHEELLKQAERLVLERHEAGHKKAATEKQPSQSPNGSEISTIQNFGGKYRADECRAAYLEKEKERGVLLKRLRRSYFKKAAGLTVGITYSSEDRTKSCPWFLNLLDGQFDEAVLLCEISKQMVQVIHLPKTFFDRYGKQMSHDKKGQVKFNVSKRNGRFFLQVPDPVGWIDIMDYTEKEPLVCPHLEFI